MVTHRPTASFPACCKVALAFLLTGCGAVMDQLHPPPADRQPSQTQSPPPAEPPAAVHKPPPPPPPKPKPIDPALLSGLDEGAVTQMLGPPSETRLQGAGKIAIWNAEHCVFDVTMFQDVKSGAWLATGWQVEDGSNLSAAACFTALKGNRP